MTPAEQKRDMIRALLSGQQVPEAAVYRSGMPMPRPEYAIQTSDMPMPTPQPARQPVSSFGADRSFAPGPGVRVAQNGGDMPSPEEMAAAGFDPNSLIGLDLNTTEARNLGLAIRMMQAESQLRPREQLGTKFKERALEWLPGEVLENKIYGSGALGTDPEYQQYRNARDSFANASLRADTGATINESELPEIIRESMPLPGDTPETIEQKRLIREGRIRAMIAGTGEASALLPQPGQPIIAPQQMSDEEFLKSLGIE